ncbi:MAG: hypothetical protein V8S74_05865 [Lachnospirales bacterium]
MRRQGADLALALDERRENQEVLDGIVADFNASQDKYEVVAENQGTYDESTGKFFSMANGDGSADIVQMASRTSSP